MTPSISPTMTSVCAARARSPDKQMPNGIWRIKDGVSTLVLSAETLGGIPNGVVLSPDERYLYLSALQKMMRYEVRPDGSLGAGSLFTEGPGIGDGMKVDVNGNVYSTSGAGPGIVRITAPSGTLLGYLNLRLSATSRSGRSARRTSPSAIATARACMSPPATMCTEFD